MFKNRQVPSEPAEKAAEPAARPPRATWQTLIATFTFAAIVASIFGGRAAYRAATDFWSRRLADKASAQMKEEKWDTASLIIGDAVRKAPDDPHVLRVTAEFLRKTNGDPEMARFFLQKLRDAGTATPEDKIHLAEVLLTTGDVPRAREVYDELPTMSKQSRDAMELFAKILDEEGEKQLAMSTLRQALLKEPDNPECILRLAMLDLDQPFDETRRHAQDTIWTIARKKDATALQAIGFLAGSKDLKAGEADELLKTVNAHPQAADRHRFPVLSAYMRLFPTRRQEVLDEECEKYNGKGPDAMVPLLRWLAQERQSERILGLVPKSLVLKSTEAFPPYADALMAAGKWADLKAMIQGSPAPAISQANAYAYLATCNSKLEPNLVSAKQHIENAYRAAEKSGELQTTLRCAQLAESLGLWDLAAAGYESIATKNARVRVTMLTKVFEMAALSKNGEKMLTVATRLQQTRPDSWMFKSRVDYLRLVLGSGFEEVCETLLSAKIAATAAAEDPTAASYSAVLRALAAYRIGDHARIKSELEGVKVTESLPPGMRAVIAGLLKFTNGDPALAFKLAEAVPQTILLNEELNFLRMAL